MIRFRRQRPFTLLCIIGILTIGALLALASILNATQYSALASTIQAVAVVPAVAIAALALVGDSRDKRVDRVLELHKEFNSGEIEAAKYRLQAHLREHGADGKVRPSTRDELRIDRELSSYSFRTTTRPAADVNLILRFFERANAARIAHIVDAPMLVELIGRHATWWNLAIKDTGLDEVPRAPLRELAAWADSFALANQEKYRYFQNWGSNRSREFGHSITDRGET